MVIELIWSSMAVEKKASVGLFWVEAKLTAIT